MKHSHPASIISSLAVILAAVAPAWTQEAPDASTAESQNNPLNAVVKLEVSKTYPNIFRPWVNITDSATGSGVVIDDGLILTCAHCVANSSYIRVRKQNEDALYHAHAEFIDNDADLALVRVEDAAFMADIDPMELGDTPHVQDDVLAVGYPIGGDDISFTRGIVSRIEDIRYSHGWTRLLGVQVDAAINPGNSGGPVLDMNTGKIAGIAFQGKDEGESLGYIIPPEIIRHFLADIRDGKVDGFSDFLFAQSQMESPAKRRYYKMDSEHTGVIVEDVGSVLGDSLRTDDIILEIDGFKVSNNGRIRLAGGEARSLYYPIYLRQIGEKVPVKVLRDGAIVETSITAAKKNMRIRRWMYDTKPDYFVYGGLVLSTASYDYMVRSKVSFHDDINEDRQFEGDEPVVISWDFADVGMEGYIGTKGSLVRSVNGVKVRNLRHLVDVVEQCRDGFVRFGLDQDTEWDVKMIVDAKEMRETTARVMSRYQIPVDRSEDLLTPAEQ